MKLVVGLSLAALAISACATSESDMTAPVFEASMGVVANDGSNAAVPLSGDEEVPARLTRARGAAIFHLRDDGAALDYKLNVANIENVVQAHIHIGAVGVNGPIAVFLFGPVAAGGGRVDGGIAEGTITAANLIGPLLGMTLDDLVAELLAGNAYVNVHTNDGVAPINSGPGDFPGGEIRGQIR